ncbi:hypothetical protein OKW33_003830 [Paraburkholderia atlantica]
MFVANAEPKLHTPEEQHRGGHHGLAAEAVRERARAQCAEREAEQPAAHHRAERIARNCPRARQRRRNKADHHGIEPIERHDEHAHQQYENLKAPDTALVEPLLHVECARRGRAVPRRLV